LQHIKCRAFVLTRHSDRRYAERSHFTLYTLRRTRVEMIYGNKLLTSKEMEMKIFEYIEIWYNKNRRHSALKNLTIEEFNNNILKNLCSLCG
jgi:transposase InsO family protein